MIQELPRYSKGEEIFNAVTHIVGGALGIVILVLTTTFASLNHHTGWEIFSCVIYGLSVITLYTMSSLYHFLSPKMTAKRVFRILDHCTIFFLIAGTYTPFLVMGLKIGHYTPDYALILLILIWVCAFLGITFNAINMHWKVIKLLSQVIYLIMGWSILIAIEPTIDVMGLPGFILMLIGGVFYTLGAILYGVGKSKKWMHSIFHLFVLFGTIIQFFSIFFFVVL